jgi:hypothetical protein
MLPVGGGLALERATANIRTKDASARARASCDVHQLLVWRPSIPPLAQPMPYLQRYYIKSLGEGRDARQTTARDDNTVHAEPRVTKVALQAR